MTDNLPHTHPVVIEPALQSDLAEILVLYRDAGIDSGRPLDQAEAERIFTRMSCYPDYRLYVAKTGCRIVGTFALLIMDNLGHQGTKAGIVEAVAVHPSVQGLGIGRAMMEYAKHKCRDAGCYKLALSSNLRRTDAHQFYQALGFKQHGISFVIDPAS